MAIDDKQEIHTDTRNRDREIRPACSATVYTDVRNSARDQAASSLLFQDRREVVSGVQCCFDVSSPIRSYNTRREIYTASVATKEGEERYYRCSLGGSPARLRLVLSFPPRLFSAPFLTTPPDKSPRITPTRTNDSGCRGIVAGSAWHLLSEAPHYRYHEFFTRPQHVHFPAPRARSFNRPDCNGRKKSSPPANLSGQYLREDKQFLDRNAALCHLLIYFYYSFNINLKITARD